MERNSLAYTPNRCLRRLSLMAIAMMAGSPAVLSSESFQDFNISPQNLGAALNAFADKAGVQLSYPAGIADGVKSPGVSGRMSPQNALNKLLEGTGIDARSTKNGTMTLEKSVVPAREDGASEATALPKIKVMGKAMYESTDPYNPDYTRSSASTATKTDTPLMQTPMSIKVIPQQVLRDQQVVRIDKALENVSGVYAQPSSLGEISFFSVRGFGGYDGASSFLYRNGVRGSYAGADASFPDMANVERIEVLKGPASILYGRIEPGGMVNLVTKQPLSNPYYSFQQQFGSFDLYRTAIDATGPVFREGRLSYRLNLAYENKQSFQDFARNDRVFVAPNFRWDISDKTSATFWLDYTKAADSIMDTIPALGSRPAPVPRRRSYGEPQNGQMRTEEQRFGFGLTHAFNEKWKIRQVFDARHNESMLDPFVGNLGIVDQAACSIKDCAVARYGQAFRGAPRHTSAYFTSLDLTGRFDTWGLEHTLVVGGDYWRSHFDATGNEIVNLFGGEISNIDLYRPVYSAVPKSAFVGVPGFNQDNSTQDWFGLYAQDQVELPHGVHLLGGLRYDNAASHDDETRKYTNKDDRVSPRFALLWQPLSELSFYGNYVENFGASTGQSSSGAFLPPQTAQQWELGAKSELLKGKLIGSVAWFDIAKQNVSVPDPNVALAKLGFVTPIGEVRNKGLEFDLSGEIVDGWKLIGSYAYIQSAITKDVGTTTDNNGNVTGVTTGNTGHRLFGVPRHGASLWSTYDFQGGLLQGLKVGGGVLVRSQQQANNENTVQLPGYALVNLLAAYQWTVGQTKLTAQLNIDNLLDKTYYLSQGFGGGPAGFAGAPRSFLGSVRVEY